MATKSAHQSKEARRHRPLLELKNWRGLKTGNTLIFWLHLPSRHYIMKNIGDCPIAPQHYHHIKKKGWLITINFDFHVGQSKRGFHFDALDYLDDLGYNVVIEKEAYDPRRNVVKEDYQLHRR